MDDHDYRIQMARTPDSAYRDAVRAAKQDLAEVTPPHA
jgi:hypothetical protein